MLLSNREPNAPTVNLHDPFRSGGSLTWLAFPLITLLLTALLLFIAISSRAGPASAYNGAPVDAAGVSRAGVAHPSVVPATGLNEQPSAASDFLDDVTLWSATMTARVFPEIPTFTGYSSHDSVGALDSAAFVAAGQPYTINVLALSPFGNALGLRISPDLDLAEASNWILLIDGEDFAFEDAGIDLGYEENETLAIWDESGLSWEDGQQVSLRLIEWEPGTCPVGEEVALSTLDADGSE